MTVDADNPNFCVESFEGALLLYNKNKTNLVQFLNASKITEFTIPDNVKTIGERAFSFCDLTSVTIPDSVRSIGQSAFSSCDSLTSVTIPDSVTSIGSEAFYGCDSLTSVTIGNGITGIGYKMFSDCTNLTSVTIPYSVTSIGSQAFYRCESLTSITIPDSVKTIGSSAFELSGLKDVYYCGTKEQWQMVSKGIMNHILSTANIHYINEFCSCNCHKSGFMGFIWKITLFFNKLFKTNKTCACGAIHY